MWCPELEHFKGGMKPPLFPINIPKTAPEPGSEKGKSCAAGLAQVPTSAKLCWAGLGLFLFSIHLVFTNKFSSNLLISAKHGSGILLLSPVLRTCLALSSVFSLNGMRFLRYQLREKPCKEIYLPTFDTSLSFPD